MIYYSLCMCTSTKIQVSVITWVFLKKKVYKKAEVPTAKLHTISQKKKKKVDFSSLYHSLERKCGKCDGILAQSKRISEILQYFYLTVVLLSLVA